MWRSVIASLLILGGALGMSWSNFGYDRAGAAYVKKRRAERGLLKVGSPASYLDVRPREHPARR
jgi:hypothetical protein